MVRVTFMAKRAGVAIETSVAGTLYEALPAGNDGLVLKLDGAIVAWVRLGLDHHQLAVVDAAGTWWDGFSVKTRAAVDRAS